MQDQSICPDDPHVLAALASQTPVRRIGQIDAQTGLRLLDAQGEAVANTFTSFDHFA